MKLPLILLSPRFNGMMSMVLGLGGKGRTSLVLVYLRDVEIRFWGSNLRKRLLDLRVTLATRFVFQSPALSTAPYFT